MIQTVVVIALFVIAGSTFYVVRSNQLNSAAALSASQVQGDFPAAPLGDVSQFVVITQDTLTYVQGGQQSQATSRITDLETAWDQAAATLQRRDKAAWTRVDDKIDTALREVRSTSPVAANEEAALKDLLTQLGAQPAGVTTG